MIEHQLFMTVLWSYMFVLGLFWVPAITARYQYIIEATAAVPNTSLRPDPTGKVHHNGQCYVRLAVLPSDHLVRTVEASKRGLSVRFHRCIPRANLAGNLSSF